MAIICIYGSKYIHDVDFLFVILGLGFLCVAYFLYIGGKNSTSYSTNKDNTHSNSTSTVNGTLFLNSTSPPSQSVTNKAFLWGYIGLIGMVYYCIFILMSYLYFMILLPYLYLWQ